MRLSARRHLWTKFFEYCKMSSTSSCSEISIDDIQTRSRPGVFCLNAVLVVQKFVVPSFFHWIPFNSNQTKTEFNSFLFAFQTKQSVYQILFTQQIKLKKIVQFLPVVWKNKTHTKSNAVHRLVFLFLFCHHLKYIFATCTLHIRRIYVLVCLCVLKMYLRKCYVCKCNKCVVRYVARCVFKLCLSHPHAASSFSTVSFQFYLALLCVAFLLKFLNGFCIFLCALCFCALAEERAKRHSQHSNRIS